MEFQPEVIGTKAAVHGASRREIDAAFQQQARLLVDEELAELLCVTLDWVRTHATEIPGFERLGQYYRFRSSQVTRWLGSLDKLLLADSVAALLGVPESWVYANADDIPGVLRLGRFIRFRPRILHAWIAGSERCQ